MIASPMADRACPSCGEELAPGARFCQSCGVATGRVPSVEMVPGPVAHESVERRWLGLPLRFVLLCLGFAAFGAAIGLFATGSWAWGIVLLLLAIVLLAALAEASRRRADAWMQHSSRLASDGRAQAATTAEVWRARLEASVSRWRTRSRLDAISDERGPALQALGEAVWRGDEPAERKARERLVELEQESKRIEDELAKRLAGADERIRRARLPVQETLMVTPNDAGSAGGRAADARQEDPGPNPPYPPPDEGNPPQPAEVPEPYPPPDEGTPPVPAPDPGRPESE
ncbi:MAG TPA: zinc ribbon domain-containing protein [Gaiellaceae bacterium]